MDAHNSERIAMQIIAITRRLWRPGYFAMVVACFIAAVSLMPAENARSLPGGDFAHHAIPYGLLSLCALLIVTGRLRSGIVLLCVFGFGAALECIQPFFGRVSDFHDLMANAAGIVAGLGAAIGVRGVLQRRENL
jgi:VanZ family protein